MSELYLLKPEVAGGWGNATTVERDNLGVTKRITHLDYEFSGWLGDDLLTTSPCFIVSEPLHKAIASSNLSGVSFEPITISKSQEFIDLYGDRQLPLFTRLIPHGQVTLQNSTRITEWSNLDFSIGGKTKLIVTQEALNLIQKFQLNHCEIILLNS